MADPRRVALARLTGMTVREIDCLDDAVLTQVLEGELGEDVVWRLRRVRRLRRHLGLDYEAIEIIVRLIDRLEELEDRGPGITVRVLSE